jgi:hypothetical protein
VEKYGTAREATNDNIIRHMCFGCQITKATDTHSEYVILIVFHGNSGYMNAPHCYVCMYIAYLISCNGNSIFFFVSRKNF